MGETITTRVDDDMAHQIDFFSKIEKVDKSTITRRLIARALGEENIDYALGKYQKGEITLGRAAEIAQKDLREMIFIASARDISFQFSLKDLKDDFEAVK